MKSAIVNARAIGIDTTKCYHTLSSWSLKAALREQGMIPLVEKLREIIPNVQDQYTDPSFQRDFNPYWELKTRGLHAFQVQFVSECIDLIANEKKQTALTMVDIGDSSGNHNIYLKNLLGNKLKRFVSANLDPVAVEKIQKKGAEAILCRAEELKLDHAVDLYTSFQMVEHLFNPVEFLNNLATKGSAQNLIFSVPLRFQSQVGLLELRRNHTEMAMTAEGTHIFELSPEDWTLLAQFSGWQLVKQKHYFQYPKFHPLRITSPIWNRYDFPGFWAGYFKRDLSTANRYKNWK